MTGAAKFDPFAVLGETQPAAPPSTPKPGGGSAKAAKVAKVGATLAGLATLAGCPPRKSASDWGELTPVVEWFLASTPPSEPFRLQPGVRITDPVRWWRGLAVDVAAGPGTRRDRYGAVRGDLRRLYTLLG